MNQRDDNSTALAADLPQAVAVPAAPLPVAPTTAGVAWAEPTPVFAPAHAAESPAPAMRPEGAPVAAVSAPAPMAPVVPGVANTTTTHGAETAQTHYALPTDALQSLAASAGLEWVNSDADKIRAVQQAMADAPKAIHVPREPRQQTVVDDGPLVLVETRKDLSQLKLPFDQQAGR